MRCGPSKSAGRTSGEHYGVATNHGSIDWFDYAREHADASGLLNHQNPSLPALFSIDLEQEARLDNHEERLEELEATLAYLSERDVSTSETEDDRP